MNIQYLDNKKLFVLFVILSITFLAFSSTLSNQFTALDDPKHLLENPHVLSLDKENIVDMFSSTINKTYIPLTTLSFAIEYHFFKFEPFIYHLNNLLLHLAVTGLVFYFGCQLGLSVLAAGLGALLFGVHPMRAESVAWVTERKDVLYAFFYMLSLCQYWNYLTKKKYASFWFSVIFGILSILAKPMALSLPLVFCILDWFHRRKITRAVIWDKLVHFAYIIPIVWISASTHKHHLPKDSSIMDAVLSIVWTSMFYIQKFIYPKFLSPIYDFPYPISLKNPELFFAAGLFIIYGLCMLYYRKHRWFTFANLYFIFSIFFLVRVRPDPGVNFVGDRFMYLPSLGFCFLFGICVENIFLWMKKTKLKFQWIFIMSLSVMFGVLSVKTYRQSQIWYDDFTLWENTLQKTLNNPFPYFARGKMYHERGEYHKAIADYTKTIELEPKWITVYNNRGILYYKLGAIDLAIADYTKALELDPKFAKAYNNRGTIYYELKKDDLALADYNKAIELDPEFTKSYTNRGLLYYALFKDRLALVDFNKSIELDSKSVRSYISRADLYSHTNRHQLAIKDLSKAIELDPFNGKVYYKRSQSYLAIKEFRKALTDAIRAQSLGVLGLKESIQEIKNQRKNI
ncbi:TPR domain protein, putative component of TonB system [hydrothermal vent metagenome]|uniref:TPR domain protein, putative component of TonB system n=1 Tax=hydrothermal vent metagenome TaxID=652676 RepID=A0A3B1D421_9ZZZZ